MIAVALAALLGALPSPEVSISHRRVVTADGASLSLSRFDPPGHGLGRPPVLLVADVGFGRELFDFEGRGLARALSAAGRRVYVAELRGQGRASGGGDLRRLVAEDLPAVANAVHQDQPGPFDLVAHGWVGSLAMGATTAELRGQVRRVVALSTPVLAEPPSRLVQAFLGEGGKTAALNDSAAGAKAFELMFAMTTSFPGRTLDELRATAARDLPRGVADDLLGWMVNGDLPLLDGSSSLVRLRAYDRPTLQFLALADGFANPELCGPLREVSKAKVTLITFSRFVDGDDSGHLSMLLGRGAEARVFAPVNAFLSQEDAP